MTHAFPTTFEPTTELSIDLNALRHNYRTLVKASAPAKVHAVVKADAYGLGVDTIAPVLWKEGCRVFYVASLEEGIELRSYLPQAEIRVFYGPLAHEPALYEAHGLIPVLNTLHQIALWQSHEGSTKQAVLHFDTGMNRLGLTPHDVGVLAKNPSLLRGLDLTTVLSHLACPDDTDHPKNQQQLDLFTTLTASFPNIPKSLAASYGIYLGNPYLFDSTRPGAALYGIVEAGDLKPVISLRSKVLQIKEVPAGETIGYGATYRTPTNRKIATLGLGYSGGYLRTGSNSGLCHFKGLDLPTVGRVSMDLITLDITDAPSPLHEGEWLDLIGPEMPINSFATHLKTIGYELLLTLGRSLNRHYRNA